jgi:cathepsin F
MKFIYIATIILLLSAISCFNFADLKTASDAEIFEKFQSFLNTYSKSYTTIEETKERFEIFKENYINMQKHNQINTLKNYETAEMGVTQFFDLTTEEFRRNYLNLNISTLNRIKANYSEKKITINNLKGPAPDSYDWREHGAVTPVKNQGTCGSCWAFSAIGNIEAQYQIKTNKSAIFSEQQLVDCDTVDQGCNGGLMDQAFDYLEKEGGVMSAADYSYSGRGQTCRFDKTKVAARVTGYKFASGKEAGAVDEKVLKQMLYENGPFAIAINASTLQFYFGGIVNPWSFLCNPKGLNHGVLLVGYGVEGNKPYWIVKNSWGSGWGEKGFFRIIAGKGACGLNTFVVSAEVEAN